jgi:hypothetical protein
LQCSAFADTWPPLAETAFKAAWQSITTALNRKVVPSAIVPRLHGSRFLIGKPPEILRRRLREFNNWIKAVLIDEFLLNKSGATVLDLCGGKVSAAVLVALSLACQSLQGGDMNKFIDKHVGYWVCAGSLLGSWLH